MTPTLKYAVIGGSVVVAAGVVVLVLYLTGVLFKKKTDTSETVEDDLIEINGRGVIAYAAFGSAYTDEDMFKDASGAFLRFVDNTEDGLLETNADASGYFTIMAKRGHTYEMQCYDFDTSYVKVQYFTGPRFDFRDEFDGTFIAPELGSSYTLPRIYEFLNLDTNTFIIPDCGTPGWHIKDNVNYECIET